MIRSTYLLDWLAANGGGGGGVEGQVGREEVGRENVGGGGNRGEKWREGG